MYMCETRHCSRCDTAKPLTEWSTSGRTKTGKQRYKSYCKPCSVAYNREKYYGGRTRPPVHKRTDTHRECMECHEMFMYEECNGAYCKPCYKSKYRDGNEEKHREYTAAYRKRHPERWRAAHRIHQFNRRSLIKAADDGTVTDEVLKNLLNKSLCCWCEKYTKASDRTIEHIVELSDGGLHSASNLDMACGPCNFSRIGKRNNE
jgi:hypothetical protein